MKTRRDFVSNSSSCSYVVALGPGYAFGDFVADAAEACLRRADEDDEAWSGRQDELNRAVLGYHLRVSELLYLGALAVEPAKTVYRRGEGGFDYVKREIAAGGLSPDERVVEDGEDEVVIEYDQRVSGMAVPEQRICYVTGRFRDDAGPITDSRPEDAAEAADGIEKFAENYADKQIDYKARADSDTYFVSRRTVWNTRALIASGRDVKLEKWMDLDALDARLAAGERIFCVKVNNGGDGVDPDALYTFGGWDGEDVFDGLPVEVIHGEPA